MPGGELSSHRREDVVAGLLATAAHLATNLAVLHAVLAVLLALITANAAGFGAGLECRAGHLSLKGRLTGEDASRDLAYVGAVEVEPDTACERLGVILPKAGVGAGGAALGTVEAGLYTLYQCGGVHRSAARTRLKHLLGVGHEGSFL